MTGIWKKPKKATIYQSIMGAKKLVSSRKWKVAYRNIPRELNTVPDYMCRTAEHNQRVEFWGGKIPNEAPKFNIDDFKD